MSQSAGTAYVDIVARLDSLDSGLASAKQAALKSGSEAGTAFGSEFADGANKAVDTQVEDVREVTISATVDPANIQQSGASAGQRFSEEFSNKASAILKSFAGPAFAATLAKATASVLRSDKSMPDAILDAIKSIPFVGAFADLGSAIYEATYGAADKAAEDLIAQQAKANEARTSFAADRQKEFNAAQNAAAALIYEQRRLEIETELNLVRETGDKEAIVRAEYAANIAKQELELTERQAKGINDVELNALLKLNQAKRVAWEEEGNARLMNVWKEAAEKEKADQERRDAEAAEQAEKERKDAEAIATRAKSAQEQLEIARLERDEAAKAAGADAKTVKEAAEAKERGLRAIEREKALRDAQSDAERKAIEERFALEEETAAIRARANVAGEAAARSMSSASTALGTFTFDPYPAAEQKKIQMEIASNTKKMAEGMASGGFQ